MALKLLRTERLQEYGCRLSALMQINQVNRRDNQAAAGSARNDR
jgi:hypothetical protein